MAFKPFQYLDDNIADPGDLVSFEAFNALAENVNYLMDSMPVGRIIAIMTGFPGVPAPDPTIWAELDGATITEENSPVRDQPAPDWADEGRYARSADVVGTIGNFGGGNEKDLTHNHSGLTDYNFLAGTLNAEDDSDANIVVPHRHAIGTDLTVVNFEPEHFVVKHYIKIR